ncbi:hypothetical protein B0T24DRAFT_229707 [Lasiosphaeria ovina]|uniref:Uncharacterized protein n=1 Tax=Lasiosphaeria ovina TaxID=92902 RepID=A0AAE0NB52_9PEZI|nr:hypothetical protein B0T24DRAFT_229707 [Lasiosphaeria ovina]
MGVLGLYNFSELLFGGLVQLITLPYHRFFTYNTLRPIQEVLRHASTGVQPDSPDRRELHAVLVGWRTRKKDELSFVAVAATVMTAIDTASFSWGNVATSHWVGPAFWYAALTTSVFGIFLAAQQLSLLSLMGELPEDHAATSARVMTRHLGQVLGRAKRKGAGAATGDGEAAGQDLSYTDGWVLNWRLIFNWQCPMMFIAYSTLFYMVGLTVVACTPLLTEEWGNTDTYVSVAYLVSLGLSLALFALCSLGYNKISMHGDEDGPDETDRAATAADDVVAVADAARKDEHP